MRIWNITLTWSLKKRVKGSVLKFTILQLNPTRPTGVFLRGTLKVEFHFIRLIWDKAELLCVYPPCYVLLLAFTHKSQFRDSSAFFRFFLFKPLFFFFSCSTLFGEDHPQVFTYTYFKFRTHTNTICTSRLVEGLNRYEKQEEERRKKPFLFSKMIQKKYSSSLNWQSS